MHIFRNCGCIVGFSERIDGDLSLFNFDMLTLNKKWASLMDLYGLRLSVPVFAHQTHGDNFIEVFDASLVGCVGNSDALITNLPNVTIGVFTADCLPIIVTSSVVAAAIHAGWKGTRKNICGRVLRHLREKYNIRLCDVTVIMGPCIGACCLELGDEVPPTFFQEKSEYSAAFSHGRKWHLDLRGLNVMQCLEEGVPLRNIQHINDCTKCYENKYFSYRREHGRQGSMFSFVSLLT